RTGAWRAGALAACLLAAAPRLTLPSAHAAAGCAVTGVITSNRVRLPGVVVTIVDANDTSVGVTTSGVDGSYAITVPQAGRYTLKTEFAAFAPVARDLALDESSCAQQVDLALVLASRAGSSATAASSTTPAPPASPAPSGRGRGARPGAQP